ncbi:MAG: agmatine/peptidylarginine deiminase [Candidatus Binatia bacterium]
MPAEWEPHEATWMAWPHNPETWPGQLESVRDIWVEIVRAISPGEKVRLLVDDERTEEEAAARLRAGGADMGHVSFCRITTVDVWIRDYGPTFITRREGETRLALNDWVFNAWGRKYDAYLRDDAVAGRMARLLQVPAYEPALVLEGGSIDVNGSGTCLSTEQCLQNPNRNPHLGQREIEQILRDYLGVSHFIWLGQGIMGDDTDGHVDNLARFVNPTTVVCTLEANTRDENYIPLRENYERLQAATDQNGEKLTVVPLPQPGRVDHGGTRLPASYANFYIANEAVLVPIYNHPNDRLALGILRSLFPERKNIGIPCGSLLVGLGGIHCVTQQEPAP